MLLPQVIAITLWNRVYIRNRKPLSDTLIRHELCHVEQWYSIGTFKFPALYIWETIRHGYRNNRFEREARGELSSSRRLRKA